MENVVGIIWRKGHDVANCPVFIVGEVAKVRGEVSIGRRGWEWTMVLFCIG